jgi:hypothetical protein
MPRGVVLCLAIFGAVLAAGCGGADDGDEQQERPLSVQERLLPPEEIPGFERKKTFDWPDAAAFVTEGIGPALPRRNSDEAIDVMTEAGFVSGAAEVLSKGSDEHLIVMALQFETPSGASDAVEWLHDQNLKPCIRVCAIAISDLSVDEIPGAKGARRVVTEQRPDASAADLPPHDRYLIEFADGSFMYVVERASPYTTSEEGDEDDALGAAQKVYDRVKGAPAAGE